MVEQRTENPRVPSSILGLGTSEASGSSSAARMPPCQGGGREFESRLPLHLSGWFVCICLCPSLRAW